MGRALPWRLACAVAVVASCGGPDRLDPPPTPANLAATPGDGVVGVRWDAAAGSDGYVVYWSTTGAAGTSGTPVRVQATSWNHSGLTNGVTYHYVVTALNAAGESPESAEVSATPLPSHYPLTISRAGTGGGTVASAPAGIDCGATCAASFATGSSVTLTATRDAGATFDGWSGDCSGTGDCTVPMDAARSVTATFTRITHQLTVVRAGTGGGAVTSTPAGIDCGATCDATFDAGTSVTLTAAPDATSTFAGWSGACTGTGDCTVTVDAAASVTATFTRVTHGLSVSRAGNGGGTVTSSPFGIDCGTTCAASYEVGTVVTLTATPDATSTFTGWSGACAGTGTCTVTVNAASSVTATFTRITYPLAVSRAGTGGGRVTSAPAGIDCGSSCSASYDAATAVVLSAAPDSTSTFAGWSGACTGTGPCSLTVDGTKSVTATFTRDDYLLSVGLASLGGGTVTSSPAGISCGATCAATFAGLTSVTLTATPDPGATFAGWSGNCTGTSPTCTVTMDRARVVAVRFTYPLTVVRSGTGTGTVTSGDAGINCGSACSASYDAGTVVTLTATASALSTFIGWSGACTNASGPCIVTTSAAKTVNATFVKNRYDVAVTRAGTGGGAVTSSPSGISCGATCTASYDGGSSVALTAAPDSTSSFAGWSGACAGTAPCTVTVDGSKSVTATFTRNSYPLSAGKAGTGGGTVDSSPSGISCGSACSASYLGLTSVTLTATPDASSTFTWWLGDCAHAGTSPTCTLTMDMPHMVTAEFARKIYTLSVTRTAGGTVASAPAGIDCGTTCSAGYQAGTSVTLTATPGAGATLAFWTGCDSVSGSTCNVAMNSARAVSATFTYPLTVAKSGTGAGTVTSAPSGVNCGSTCSASFAGGSTVTLTATPGPLSDFTGWSGAGCSGTGTCVVAMDVARAVTATFTMRHTLAVTVVGTGSVQSSPAGITCSSGTCTASYGEGMVVTVTATPGATSVFAGWSGACTGTGTCAVTLDLDRSVTAVFTP